MHLEAFELDEHQRQAVDVADHVRAAQPQAPAHPHLAHGQIAVVVALVEVDQAQPLVHQPAGCVPIGHRHAIAQQLVLLFVQRHQRLGDVVLQHLRQRLAVGLGRQARVQPLQGCQYLTAQHHLGVVAAAQQAVRAEVLVVLREHGFPSELFLQQFSGRHLDQQVFRVVAFGHLDRKSTRLNSSH